MDIDIISKYFSITNNKRCDEHSYTDILVPSWKYFWKIRRLFFISITISGEVIVIITAIQSYLSAFSMCPFQNWVLLALHFFFSGQGGELSCY